MTVEHYRRWFEYEKDAHLKTLASLEKVPESRRAAPENAKALSLGAHLVAARRLWLYRFGKLAEPPKEFSPQNVALGDLRRDFDAMHALWSDYLARLDEHELSRSFEYTSLEGSRFRNTVEDILTQLFGHSWYHRGQIAQLVRGLGAEPAVTDFVFWCREAI